MYRLQKESTVLKDQNLRTAHRNRGCRMWEGPECLGFMSNFGTGWLSMTTAMPVRCWHLLWHSHGRVVCGRGDHRPGRKHGETGSSPLRGRHFCQSKVKRRLGLLESGLDWNQCLGTWLVSSSHGLAVSFWRCLFGLQESTVYVGSTPCTVGKCWRERGL